MPPERITLFRANGLLSLATASVLALTVAGTAGAASQNQLSASISSRDLAVLDVVAYSGNVTIRPSARSSVEVSATIVENGSGAPANVQLFQNGDASEITVCPARTDAGAAPSPCEDSRLKLVQVDLSVAVPSSVRVNVSVRNGNINASGIANSVTADTRNGQVVIDTRGNAAASTGNGNITVSMGEPSSSSGPLQFKSTNGSISIRLPRASSARLYAASKTGSIDVPRSAKLFANTANVVEGAIGSGAGGSIRAVTENGDIRITM